MLVWTNHSSPGVLRLLEPHSAPQLVDDLDPEAGLTTHIRSVDILWKYSDQVLIGVCPHPVLHVQLAELAVCLDLAVAAGHLLHEGAQLHGLGDQGAAHGAVVGVRLGGEGEVVPGQGEDVMEMLDG